MATQNMLDFMRKNQSKTVVFGERRTPDNKPVLTKADMDCSDRVVYRFEDGEEMALLTKDSRSEPNFTPKWANG